MNSDFEKNLASILSIKHPGEKIIRDPQKSKQQDHQKREKGVRFDKKKKSVRKAFHRAFRAENNRFCREVVTTKEDEVDHLVEPILKKTSGWLTW